MAHNEARNDLDEIDPLIAPTINALIVKGPGALNTYAISHLKKHALIQEDPVMRDRILDLTVDYLIAHQAGLSKPEEWAVPLFRAAWGELTAPNFAFAAKVFAKLYPAFPNKLKDYAARFKKADTASLEIVAGVMRQTVVTEVRDVKTTIAVATTDVATDARTVLTGPTEKLDPLIAPIIDALAVKGPDALKANAIRKLRGFAIAPENAANRNAILDATVDYFVMHRTEVSDPEVWAVSLFRAAWGDSEPPNYDAAASAFAKMYRAFPDTLRVFEARFRKAKEAAPAALAIVAAAMK